MTTPSRHVGPWFQTWAGKTVRVFIGAGSLLAGLGLAWLGYFGFAFGRRADEFGDSQIEGLIFFALGLAIFGAGLAAAIRPSKPRLVVLVSVVALVYVVASLV